MARRLRRRRAAGDRHAQRRQAARDRGPGRAARGRGGRAPAHSACRSRRRRRRISSATRGSRRWRRRAAADAAGAGRRFRLLRRRPRRRAGRALGALGRAGGATSPPRWRGCSARWARRRIAAPGSSARSASPGRTGTRDSFFGRVEGTLQPGRRAATSGFGYDPMFVPTGAQRRPSARWHRRKSTRSATARAPSPSSPPRAWARDQAASR